MRPGYLLVSLICLFILSNCSSTSPVDPRIDKNPDFTHSVSIGRTLWGIWDVSIDSDSMTAETVPMRAADFTGNVTRFLQPPISPIQMLSIQVLPESKPNEGLFVLDVTVRHPFPGLNKYKGFDVRGILFSNGSVYGQHDQSVILAGQDETQLLNADGFTRWWNFTEFTTYGTLFGFTFGKLAPPNQPTATVNPYKQFADILGPETSTDELNIGNRGGFSPSAPSMNTRRYEIQFKIVGGQKVFDFQYAIDASWAKPDESYEPDYPVQAFPPEANCNEAFRIVTSDGGSTAWWKSPSEFGGNLNLDLEVSDWQAIIQPGGAIDEVSEIWLEGPILNEPVEILGDAIVIPTDELSFKFTVTLENLSLSKAGTEYLFGTVVSKSPSTYEPQVPGGSAFDYPDAPLSAYFMAAVEIKEGSAEKPIWPTIMGNRANTGCIGLNGPQDVHFAPTWTHLWQPNPYGNPLPVFLSADTAFLSNTGDGGPLPAGAVDIASQTTKWNQQFHDDMQNWLNLKCISEDGQVALCFESKYNTIYGLDAEDGSELWHVMGSIKVDSYPTTDLNGNFIIPLEDVGYQSIEPHTGSLNWTSITGDGYYSIPAVGENGVIYCTVGGMWDGVIYALDPLNGSVKWQSDSIGLLRGNGVTVHPYGYILAYGGDGLFCFQDNGDSCSIIWQQPYSCPFYACIGVGPSNDIYIMDYDGVLRRLDPETGETIQSTSGWGDGVTFRPAIGGDGLIYAQTRLYDENQAFMTCWNADCTLRWQYLAGQWFMGDGMMAAPSIGQDGTLYSSYRSLGICAWKD
ncbi:MAG: PQQ-binding-like beta-propeller repeat protein [bacterium]